MSRPRFTPSQRLKCFEDHGAIVCCQGPNCDSAVYIKGCDIDHHLALIDGGKHEQSNFRPLCGSCHARKSAYEHRQNAKAKRLAKKHSGQDEATPRAKARLIPSRPWPESKTKKAWPSQKIPTRPFQRREG